MRQIKNNETNVDSINKHFYVYRLKDGIWTYDRTMPNRYYATERVNYLKTIYDDAKFLVDELLEGAYY